MHIGQASEASGLPAKTIRYYEEIGLVSSDRRGNNYRDYSDTALHNLRFLARARALGFSIEECRQLLSLYADKSRASADVRQLASTHIGEIDAKIAELKAMRHTLSRLVEACHGDRRPDCPILEDLAGHMPARQTAFPHG
jgi:Cu(I)-responsive transcriptional regulator